MASVTHALIDAARRNPVGLQWAKRDPTTRHAALVIEALAHGRNPRQTRRREHHMAPSKDERSNVDWASPRSKRSSTNDPAEHTKGEVQWANDDGPAPLRRAVVGVGLGLVASAWVVALVFAWRLISP